MRKAAEETVREYGKWLKRYERPLKLVTEKEGPFPEGLMELLRGGYSLFPRPSHLRDVISQGIQKLLKEERPGEEILTQNINKALNKHPAWMELQRDLFKILTEKGVTERQAFRLIARLLRASIPRWFEVKHGEDAIRLNVKSHLKVQRQS